jgi:hypothetical protein
MMKNIYYIAFPYSVRMWVVETKIQLGKFVSLWKTTPADCRGQLVVEFILCPDDFERRYAEEVDFKFRLGNRWQ